MELQKQPNKKSCLPTAVAMILSVDVQNVMAEVGHNGLEIAFHANDIMKVINNHNHSCTRFEVEPRIVDNPEQALELLGQAIVDLKIYLMVTPKDELDICEFSKEIQKQYELLTSKIIALPNELEYIEELMINNQGVLLGIGHQGRPHAVAWDGGTIYDPNGEVYRYAWKHMGEFNSPQVKFDIEEFWLIRSNK